MLGSLAPRLATVPDGAPPYDGEARSEPVPAAVVTTAPVPAAPVASDSGSAGALARQFAQAITETVAGRRPFRQVIGSTTERVQDQIRGLIPLLRTDSGPKIRRILTSRPDSDVVEVTVIAGFGPRTRALAMRFEHLAARPSAPGLPPRPARWLCTDIETG
jgi:hypothetical protein